MLGNMLRVCSTAYLMITFLCVCVSRIEMVHVFYLMCAFCLRTFLLYRTGFAILFKEQEK